MIGRFRRLEGQGEQTEAGDGGAGSAMFEGMLERRSTEEVSPRTQ